MSPFQAACGVTGPLELRIEHQSSSKPEVIALEQPFALVGNDPAADVQLVHRDVSTRHAYLQIVGGRLHVLDLGSQSGTYAEGRRLRSRWLTQGKAIRIGPYRIRLTSGVTNGATPISELSPVDLVLALSHRGSRASHCRIENALTIVGSASDCGARVVDPSLASYHCGLVHTPEGLWAVDLLGPGGVVVNGSPVRVTRLNPGDELRLGRSLIRLEPKPADVGTSSERGEAELPPNTTTLIEPLLASLMSRVDSMQHQMLEQWQQAGTALLQSLSALHQEQSEHIQRELEQLHQTARELERLRDDLTQAPRPYSSTIADRQHTTPVRLGIARPILAG